MYANYLSKFMRKRTVDEFNCCFQSAKIPFFFSLIESIMDSNMFIIVEVWLINTIKRTAKKWNIIQKFYVPEKQFVLGEYLVR